MKFGVSVLCSVIEPCGGVRRDVALSRHGKFEIVLENITKFSIQMNFCVLEAENPFIQ